MHNIKAVGFDLFNTLVTMEYGALKAALATLTGSLRQNGFDIEHSAFVRAHSEAILKFLEKTKRDGRETHNRFWISSALAKLGHDVSPEDPHISLAVDSYFSVFVEYAELIPETREMLATLRQHYRVGLLSNFTHPPAARQIIDELELSPLFDVILISGELGYRKPHLSVFEKLVDGLGVKNEQISFVGDDPEADVAGSLRAGLKPIWTTYVRDNDILPVPGVVGRKKDDPDPAVPRISKWQDLLMLLNL